MGKYKQNLIKIAALAIVYFIAGKLGLLLAFVHPSATAIWPCTGIAGRLAALGDLWVRGVARRAAGGRLR